MVIQTLQTRIQVNGVSMGVLMSCDAAPRTLVLLHGFTGSTANWASLFESLTLPGLRIVAVDMLGHGLSDAPADAQRYTIEYCQQDIIAVLQAQGIQSGEAILLGYSMGGRIALYCAFSGFFRALILESASAGLADPVAREQRKREDTVLADGIERDGLVAFVSRWERIPLFASQQSLPVTIRQALHDQRLHNRPTGLANSLRGVGVGVQPALHDRLASLTIPVLMITGELDTKFCGIAQQMVRVLPHASLHTVPGSGHTVHLEQPELFTALVKDFCTSVL